jgi:hypothetical protein
LISKGRPFGGGLFCLLSELSGFARAILWRTDDGLRMEETTAPENTTVQSDPAPAPPPPPSNHRNRYGYIAGGIVAAIVIFFAGYQVGEHHHGDKGRFGHGGPPGMMQGGQPGQGQDFGPGGPGQQQGGQGGQTPDDNTN